MAKTSSLAQQFFSCCLSLLGNQRRSFLTNLALSPGPDLDLDPFFLSLRSLLDLRETSLARTVALCLLLTLGVQLRAASLPFFHLYPDICSYCQNLASSKTGNASTPRPRGSQGSHSSAQQLSPSTNSPVGKLGPQKGT